MRQLVDTKRRQSAGPDTRIVAAHERSSPVSRVEHIEELVKALCRVVLNEDANKGVDPRPD
jgi:hypothetical protein